MISNVLKLFFTELCCGTKENPLYCEIHKILVKKLDKEYEFVLELLEKSKNSEGVIYYDDDDFFLDFDSFSGIFT